MYEFQFAGSTRFDNTGNFKSIYDAKSGMNTTLNVAVPIISNPPPQTFDFTWDGPVPVSVRTTISRTDVSYKHVVESVIPVKYEKYFGNYTLVYNGEIFTKITINAKGNLFQLYFCIVYIKRNLLRLLV